jgi:hypothetical protein
MRYMQKLEADIREKLAEGDTEAFIAWVKRLVYESYQNGLRDARAEEPAAKREKRAPRAPYQSNNRYDHATQTAEKRKRHAF